MGLRIKLNGIILDYQPDGIEGLTQRINFAEEDKTLGVIYDGNLTFWGDGYKMLWDAWKASTETMPVIVQKLGATGWTEEINGVINISAIQFNRFKRSAEVDIEDDSFYSRLRNNFQLPSAPKSNLTKNGSPITEVDSIDITLYNPATGTQSGMTVTGARRMYDLKDTLTVLVKVATDDGMALASTWYDNLETYERIAIATGTMIRTAAGENVIVSISQIWEFLRKKFNLCMYQTIVDGIPTVNIEELSKIENINELLELRDVPDVEQTIDQSLIYAGVKFGAKSFKSDGSFSYVPYISFKPETYQFKGRDNIDSIMDLTDNNFHVDSNIIEDAIINDNDQYDDDIFLIQYKTTDMAASVGNPLSTTGATARVYNANVINSIVAERYSFQGDVALTFGVNSIGFRALTEIDLTTQSSDDTWKNPIQFSDSCNLGQNLGLNYDGGGTLQVPIFGVNNAIPSACSGTGSFAYTAPSTGLYTIRILLGYGFKTINTDPNINLFVFDTTIDLIKNGSTVIATSTQPAPISPVTTNLAIGDPPMEHEFIISVYLSASDVLTTNASHYIGGSQVASFQNFNSGVYIPTITKNSTFETLSVPDGFDILEDNDASIYKNVIMELDHPLSDKDRRLIVDDPTRAVKITDESGNFKGFHKSVDSNILTGETSFTLRTSKSLIN